MADHTLPRDEIRALYDRIGQWQDTQQFYENPAFDALLAHASFEAAESILEVGCGTGRLADQILREHAPPSAHYEGLDLSGAMVQIARERLSAFGGRATVSRTDGALSFAYPDGSQDCIVATYLLDLLSQDDARTLLAEAHRLLNRNGRLCLTGLTWGPGLQSKVIPTLWNVLHRLRPHWVGGCRPIQIRSHLPEERWCETYHTTITAWGVPSEVLIATPV